MNFYIVTLGCKVNQYESEEIRENLLNSGFAETADVGKADIFIVNSCAVTSESERKTRQTVRRYRKINEDACVVLTGCVPSAFPDDAKKLTEADIVISNRDNKLISEKINKFYEEKQDRITDITRHERNENYEGGIIRDFEGHTRAFVKIQDGCDRYCTYCAIPFAKGPSRSKPLDKLREELNNVSSSGFKEVVLIGINLSSYGMDCGLSLSDAVKEAQKTYGIERIRLGSLEPDHITDDIISGFSECSKLCPQFHLALQSGCDRVLKKMNRHYDTSFYYNLCVKLENTFPDLSITTDIMTGFPGETEEDFLETEEFVRKIGFLKVHVFPYSRREGTVADKMEGQIEKNEKERRARDLIKVSGEVRKKFFERETGKKASVLFETPEDGFQVGYTENYTPVKMISDENLRGKIVPIKLTKAENDFVLCEKISNS